jgi:hypothetical protein
VLERALERQPEPLPAAEAVAALPAAEAAKTGTAAVKH